MWKLLELRKNRFCHTLGTVILPICALAFTAESVAQNTPLISGGIAMFTSTDKGNTSYIPTLAPLIAAPLGQHLLVESRANLLLDYFPKGGGRPGYTNISFKGLTYLQLDYLANSHVTVVAGDFLTPFGTYNERLSPIWIGNFQAGPLITGLGTMSTGSSVGGMLRGSAVSTSRFSIDYSAYFSAASTNLQFDSERAAGGKAEIYFPKQRLELGSSYGRLLQGAEENFIGTHAWWEPANSAFKLRSEYAHGSHSQGFWVETEYRLSRFGGENSIIGRLEPVFRWQQTFRNSPDPTDGLPSADTQRADFGLDYLFPHEVRIDTSYSRQLSSTGNENVWQTGIVYRFLFPTWKGKR